MSGRKKNTRKPTQRARIKFPKTLDGSEVARNPEVQKAYAAIAKYQTGMWTEIDLSEAFAVRAVWAISPLPLTRQWLEEMCLEGTGESWPTLKKYPRRLKSLADEIDSLNANFIKIPAAAENPQLIAFAQLPANLRAYAEALTRQTKFQESIRPPTVERRRAEFLEFAAQFAPGYSDNDAADFFNAVAAVLGYHDGTCDATHLSQARYRHKKKT